MLFYVRLFVEILVSCCKYGVASTYYNGDDDSDNNNKNISQVWLVLILTSEWF